MSNKWDNGNYSVKLLIVLVTIIGTHKISVNNVEYLLKKKNESHVTALLNWQLLTKNNKGLKKFI